MKTTIAKKNYVLLSYSFLNAGLRFSVNAVIPSFWSCVENKDWNKRRSRRMPSASVSSYARKSVSVTHIRTCVDGLLSGLNGDLALLRDLASDVDSFIHNAALADNARYETGCLGLIGGEIATRQHDFHRATLTDGTCQTLRTTCTRDHTEVNLRLTKHSRR